MTHQHINLEDTVYFWFAANDTSGSGGDGSSPLADVRLAGALGSAAPVLSPTPTLLSHVNYPAGCYEVAVAATAANGFAADNVYAVFCTLSIDSQNPTGFIGSFKTGAIIADTIAVSGDTTAANNLEADYDGTGYAKTNSTIGTCTTNTDMRGTDSALLAASAPTNFGDLAITVTTGQVTVGTNNDKTGYSISGTKTTLDALNDVSTAEVNAQCDASIETYNLHYILHTALPTSWATNVTANSALDYMADDGTAVFDRTTDSLQAIADSGGGGPTAGQIADAVWDEATTGHTTAGTFGEQAKTKIDAILADTGTDGVVLSEATRNDIADSLLKRDWTGLTGEASRSMLNALRLLRNYWNVVGTVLNVRKEDDTTLAWTGTVSTDAAADPVTGVDPN